MYLNILQDKALTAYWYALKGFPTAFHGLPFKLVGAQVRREGPPRAPKPFGPKAAEIGVLRVADRHKAPRSRPFKPISQAKRSVEGLYTELYTCTKAFRKAFKRALRQVPRGLRRAIASRDRAAWGAGPRESRRGPAILLKTVPRSSKLPLLSIVERGFKGEFHGKQGQHHLSTQGTPLNTLHLQLRVPFQVKPRKQWPCSF